MPWMKKFERGRLLKDLSTFGIGGPADYFIEVRDIPAMQSLMVFCHTKNIPYFHLGKGSNLLFDDQGFSGLIIANRIQFLNKIDETLWHAGSGYSFSLLGTQTARQGLTGLEFASGIPGSIGGAVFMNAGANGKETSQSLTSVDVVDENGSFFTIAKEELNFSYRSSTFHEKPWVIVGATFRLEKSMEAREKQLEIIQYRKKTQPYNAMSAGCLFRNPACAHTGALIEKCGLKGKMIGGAQVSTLHANFVINTGSATSADVLELITHIKEQVKATTGYDLQMEVRFIPYRPHQWEVIHERV